MRHLVAFICIIAGLILSTTRTTADEPVPHPAKAMLDQQVADWNRKDLDSFCQGYWKSPKLVFLSGGDRVAGWDGMRERYRSRYQAEGKEMGKLTFSEVEMEDLGPESAFARGRWDLKFESGKPPVGGRFTVILRKLPEGWRIVHDHSSADAPKP